MLRGIKKGTKRKGYCKLQNFERLDEKTQAEIMGLIEQGVKIHKIAEQYQLNLRTIPSLNFWNEQQSEKKLYKDNLLIQSMGWYDEEI